jgi:hypothetical protein
MLLGSIQIAVNHFAISYYARVDILCRYGLHRYGPRAFFTCSSHVQERVILGS